MSSRSLAFAPRRPARLHRIWKAVVLHLDLRRSRRGLLRLDDHLLRDIGLTRDEAKAEASRRDWDAPPHWKA